MSNDHAFPCIILLSLHSSECVCFFFFLYFYPQYFLLWHRRSKSLFHLRILSLDMLLLHLLFLLIHSSVTQNPKRILNRTFLIRRFMLNAQSSYLIFQILCYPDCLDHVVKNFFVKNLLAVLVCLYGSSTPTYTISIPLFLISLLYFEVHVSLLLQSLFSKYSMFQGYIILTILVLLCLKLYLEMSLHLVSVSVLCLGELNSILLSMTLLRIHGFLIW